MVDVCAKRCDAMVYGMGRGGGRTGNVRVLVEYGLEGAPRSTTTPNGH